MSRTRRTPKKDWGEAFLTAFAETGMVTEACKVAGVARRTVYDRRQRDETFALAWMDVEETSTEQLEDVAVRRAKDGSDTLLIFLLKSRRPEKYRDNVKVEHGGQVDHGVAIPANKSAEELVGIADELRRRRERHVAVERA